MSNEERIKELEALVDALAKGQKANRDRIKSAQSGFRMLLALTAFSAIVWGIPIAEVKWSGEEFSFTRDTTSPELVLVGGLVAAALVSGEEPIDLLKMIVKK